MIAHHFTAADDGMHASSSDFYDTETFWFSFWVPERGIGGWLYTTVRPTAGVSGGGMWLWDATSADPWCIPFYEQFAHLKVPTERGPERLAFPNGMSIHVREPLMSYDLLYDDRDRARATLRFEALEPPVPLRSGQPPYPKAHHFDQTGRVTGTVLLDGEAIEVDCYAMRDRSWGRRNERGALRIGYCWGADADASFLTYSLPSDETDDVHGGYLRRGTESGYVVSGRRVVERDPEHGWVTQLEVEGTDEQGRTFRAEGESVSRLILPGATTICINSLMRWVVDGRTLYGEDQDVWPVKEFRRRG